MFKTQNNHSTLANQQPLDEIELMSSQEIVELSGQELMNVVGGTNERTENPLLYVRTDENTEFSADLIRPEIEVDLTNDDPAVKARPGGS